MFSLRIAHSTISGFNAKGKNTITATAHLQKARLIGGMLSLRPRAMIKLPDQIAVATRAKKYPNIICRFCSRFINLGISNFFHAALPVTCAKSFHNIF
jgi:hypothetical protein